MKKAALGLDEAREKMHAARAELIARHEQIAHLAHHDALTDLPNRTVARDATGGDLRSGPGGRQDLPS